MSSAMLWGPGELGRDEELCIPAVTRCDNSCLLRKMERWFRAKHAAGNKNIQVWTGAVLHFYKCYLLLLCLGYLAMGLCYGGLQRGWLEMAFGALFIYSWICLQWILSLCKFKDLLLSPPSVSPKVTLHKKASSQMVSVYFYYFFFNYCFVGPMLGGSLPCFFWGLRVLPACVCLPLPCGQRCEKLIQLLASHFPFSFPDFCMCSIWNPGDCLWSLVGVWKCVRTSSPRRYDVQKCAFGYPAAWFKWLQSLTRLYHHLLQHYGYYFIALTLSWANPKCP